MIIWTWAYCALTGVIVRQAAEEAPWWVFFLVSVALVGLALVMGSH